MAPLPWAGKVLQLLQQTTTAGRASLKIERARFDYKTGLVWEEARARHAVSRFTDTFSHARGGHDSPHKQHTPRAIESNHESFEKIENDTRVRMREGPTNQQCVCKVHQLQDEGAASHLQINVDFSANNTNM